MDTEILSRLQFAFTISFHILFPSFSIGLAFFLVFMEGAWLKTKNLHYLKICKFWTKVFALTFGMGIVSGIVMEFEFGTNWSLFTSAVGAVLGPLFTYEVMTAFFLEAGFVGIMFFGWERVSPRIHYFATIMVVIGTTFSAYWIMAANTWMQHPIGYLKDGNIYKVADWWQIIFNPAGFPRFFHMLLASYISALFVIVSVSSLYLLKDRHLDFAKTCFSFAWRALLILVPLQIILGDFVGLAVHHFQPLKTAAMEGVWQTGNSLPFLIFAWPDQAKQMNLWEIGIPYLSSLLNTHSLHGELIGLTTVAPSEQPIVPLVFFSFRAMVYLGVAMFGLALLATYLQFKKILYNNRWFLKISLLTGPIGFIALWCGWITAETGRQPWAVYHLLKTSHAVSNVPVHNVIISFIVIVLIYGIIFGGFYFYYLHHILSKGPADKEESLISDTSFHYMSGASREDLK